MSVSGCLPAGMLSQAQSSVIFIIQPLVIPPGGGIAPADSWATCPFSVQWDGDSETVIFGFTAGDLLSSL